MFFPYFRILTFSSALVMGNHKKEKTEKKEKKTTSTKAGMTGKLIDIYGLLTKCEVKMAGYWPNSFFANSQKKNENNIQPS